MFTTKELKTLRTHVAGVDETLTDKIDLWLRLAAWPGVVHVDVPRPDSIGRECRWDFVKTVASMPAAVAFIRDNVGHCDEWGHIALTSYGSADTNML